MTSGTAPAAASPPAFEVVVVVAVTSWPLVDEHRDQLPSDDTGRANDQDPHFGCSSTCGDRRR
jgi:hypothetical protein